MYISIQGLAQPTDPNMPTRPPTPPVPPVPPLNPMVPPTPIVSGPQVLLVGSKVQCTAPQLARIQAIVGPGIAITNDVVRVAIQSAHDNVFPDLTDEDMPPRKALEGSRTLITKERFRAAFGKLPDELPWRGARWDLGRIVATRLAGARKTMFSSSIRISCFGWPWPGGAGVDRPLDYMVKTLPKVERVALGALFWRAFATGDRVSQGAAMLIAGLVIRYGISYRVLARPLRNIHCYVKYGLLQLQHPIPQWVETKCLAEVV